MTRSGSRIERCNDPLIFAVAHLSFRGHTSMEIVPATAAALCTSWASGVNPYAAIAVLGCMHRFGAVDLPGDLDELSSW